MRGSIRLFALAVALTLSACATQPVYTRYPTWQAYQQAHPNARFVVVTTRPARGRSCWAVRGGWRCVVP
jgi:hypothetical protein